MNFQNTWYVIEQNNHYETISHEAMLLLPEGSFVMLENYASHHEALEERKRLIRLAIADAKVKLGS
jgi:hypothetical protein